MARITISSPDAERIARSFNDLIGPRGLDAIRRRAVNKTGSDIRKETRIVGPQIIGTSAAALMVQGKAASPGSDNPTYRLRMARRVPVARLKTSHRTVTRSKGRRALTLTLPGDRGKVRFRSVHRVGRTFRLLRAGPLPERGLGGIYTNPGGSFGSEGHPELRAVRRGAEKALPALVSALIDAHLSKRRR